MLKRLWHKYVMNNIGLKATSVIVAVLLWFAISYLGESQMSLSVRVSLQGLSKDLMLRKVEPEYVLLSVTGPVSELKDLKAVDVGVSVDLSSKREGSHVFTLQESNLKITKRLKVDTIKPDYIIVEIDRIAEKRLKVSVKVDEKLLGQYRVKSVYPSSVIVEGAENSIGNKSYIETKLIEGDLNTDEEHIDVTLNTKGLSIKAIKPETVRVVLKRQ